MFVSEEDRQPRPDFSGILEDRVPVTPHAVLVAYPAESGPLSTR